MKKQRDLYSWLVSIGMVVVPLAPAIASSWSMYQWMVVKGVWHPLAIIAGVTFGPSMELFLAVTGHTMLELRRIQNKMWLLVGGMMVIYPIVGLSYYGWNLVGMAFLVAVLYYIVLGSWAQVQRQDTAEASAAERQIAAEQAKTDEARERRQWELEQKALAEAHERDVQRMAYEAKLAQIKAKPVPLVPNATVVERVQEESSTPYSQYQRWRNVPETVRGELAQLDKAALQSALSHLPNSTRRDWLTYLARHRAGSLNLR